MNGSFEASVKDFSAAIEKDSMVYENYYLRALAGSYLGDTVNTVTDFFKAIDVKRKFAATNADTLVNEWLASRPANTKNICGPSLLHEQSAAFFNLWLGTWLILTGKDRHEACAALKESEKSGLRQIQSYRLKYCK